MRKKMIKTNSILFISFLTFFIGLKSVNAQEVSVEKNEIRVSVSDGFYLSTLDDFLSKLNSIDRGDYKYKDSAYGMLHLNYQRRISDKIKMGVEVAYMRLEYQNKRDKRISRTSNYFAVAPQFEYSYIKRNFFELYGNAFAGVGRHSETVNKETVSTYGAYYQLNPIGIRVGKKLGGFLEAGFGIGGFVNFGVSYRF